MSLRDRMDRVAESIRRLPDRLGERPTTVTVRTRTWHGGRVGSKGDVETTDLLLSPSPRVKQLATREIAGSGGRYEAGDVRVGPITRSWTLTSGSGGYTEEQVAPRQGAPGVEILYVLSGYVSGEYTRITVDTDGNHAFFLVLRRRRTTP